MITLIFTFQYGYIQINQAKLFGMDPGSFTFQYGYIQIFISLNLQIHITALYIPIWLYSNNANKGLMHIFVFFTFQPGYIQIKFAFVFEKSIPDFTFQPGYIQMELSSGKPSELSSFTFQPGYIQMKIRSLERSFSVTLHSNLVIFKLDVTANAPVIISFTFQPGYIQIRVL